MRRARSSSGVAAVSNDQPEAPFTIGIGSGQSLQNPLVQVERDVHRALVLDHDELLVGGAAQVARRQG